MDCGERHIKEGGFASYGGCPNGLMEGPLSAILEPGIGSRRAKSEDIDNDRQTTPNKEISSQTRAQRSLGRVQLEGSCDSAGSDKFERRYVEAAKDDAGKIKHLKFRGLISTKREGQRPFEGVLEGGHSGGVSGTA